MSQHKAPHRNWQPGPKYLTKYDGMDIPEPETLRDNYKNRLEPATTQAMTIDRHLSTNDLKIRTPGNLTPEQKAKAVANLKRGRETAMRNRKAKLAAKQAGKAPLPVIKEEAPKPKTPPPGSLKGQCYHQQCQYETCTCVCFTFPSSDH